MRRPKKDDFVPYELVGPGFEGLFTGETDPPETSEDDPDIVFRRDGDGNVYVEYSSWGFGHSKEEDWNDEIREINRMQKDLGALDDRVRRIRSQIASLQCCDSGIPFTIDRILHAIGVGEVGEPVYHSGCWMSTGMRSTQPRQQESMRVIEDVLVRYLRREGRESIAADYPFAGGFIDHVFEWLGPRDELDAFQLLLLDRMLLPFEYFTGRNTNHREVNANCFERNGRGAQLDAEISRLAGLPPIHPDWTKEFKEARETISDPEMRERYEICGAIAHGAHGLSDCHHGTFRWIERWIHAVGTGRWGIPTRKEGTERIRLERLLFGYALGIDSWLSDLPMQFLLLDLGHVDLGFDPKSEIIRVYASLGERDPVRDWLAACLWYKLVLEPPASLYRWGRWHRDFLDEAGSRKVGVRKWMDARLDRERRMR